MIEITKSGLSFNGTTQELDELRREFEREHCLLIKGFLRADFLEMMQEQVARARFHERIITTLDPPSADIFMENNAIKQAFLLLLNNSKLFEIVEHITGCTSIGCFRGGVYRMTSSYGHDTWHDDLGDNCLAGLSINLSREVYRGGVLQIRDIVRGVIVKEVANTGAGDAVIFKLAPNLQHRVTEVEGKVDKTAFAGRFKSEPDFQALLRDNLLRMRTRAESETSRQWIE